MGKAPLNEYHTFVARRIADGVQCAVGTLRPAQIAFVTAEVPEHVFNRRWVMKPGTAPPNPFGGIDAVKMNPAPGSPDLVEPAGPTDPTISILALREPGGRPIAVFSAYGLHYVGRVGSGDISADYYGMYCRRAGAVAGRQGPGSALRGDDGQRRQRRRDQHRSASARAQDGALCEDAPRGRHCRGQSPRRAGQGRVSRRRDAGRRDTESR